LNPSEKRRKTSKNSQKYTNSFLFVNTIELYNDPVLWLVKLNKIAWNKTNSPWKGGVKAHKNVTNE
jgi:hypothetical protein